MFTLCQASVKLAVLLHKQAKVPFVLSLAVHIYVIQKFLTFQIFLISCVDFITIEHCNTYYA